MARDHVDGLNRIRCLCRKCVNHYYKPIDEMENDLFINGIDMNYTWWVFAGEKDPFHTNLHADHDDENASAEDIDDVEEMLNDIHIGRFPDGNTGESSTTPGPTTNGYELKNFDQLLEDAQHELYPVCTKFSTLAFITNLLHINIFCNMSNKAFDMVIDLIKKALPDGETLPRSYYEAKQLRRGLGLSYEKIHACKNSCVLFRKEHADKEKCPTCNTSSWEIVKCTGKKIPHKVLRYFPIKSRWKRLFLLKDIAKDMRWHKDGRRDDGNLRHPADSIVWKEFDKEHVQFAKDSCNMRLGLSSDGFNPFGNMSTSYSMWPVILVPYNLPPWRCMKDPYMMMSLLIPGPKAPENEIDVYLQPLVDDLQELWNEGILTYDSSTQENFKLYAALLWTINDFPAYGNLSRWMTKGHLACPVCNKNTASRRLKFGGKSCYMAHRRFLPQGHIWRTKKSLFDGTEKHRMAPIELSRDQLLQQLENVPNFPFGKDETKKKKKRVKRVS
jgi:hypothetical protein